MQSLCRTREQGYSAFTTKASHNMNKYDALICSKELFNGTKTLCIPSNLPETDETSINSSTQIQIRIIDSMNFTKEEPYYKHNKLTNQLLKSGGKENCQF